MVVGTGHVGPVMHQYLTHARDDRLATAQAGAVVSAGRTYDPIARGHRHSHAPTGVDSRLFCPRQAGETRTKIALDKGLDNEDSARQALV